MYEDIDYDDTFCGLSFWSSNQFLFSFNLICSKDIFLNIPKIVLYQKVCKHKEDGINFGWCNNSAILPVGCWMSKNSEFTLEML